MSPLPQQEGKSSEEDTLSTISSNKQNVFTKCSIIKNLVIVAVGTFLLIGSEDILLMYQSTMNSGNGIGVTSIAIQYAFAVLSSLFLPKYLILRYGCKAVMVLSIVTYAPFYLANYRPLQFLMILTSALLGAGCSLFKGSVDLYISDIASMYAKLKNKRCDSDSAVQTVVECKTNHLPSEIRTQITDYSQVRDHRIIEKLQMEKKPIEAIKYSVDFNQTLVTCNNIGYSNKDINKYPNPTQSATDLVATNNLYNTLDEKNNKPQDTVPNAINYMNSNSEVLNLNSVKANNQVIHATELKKEQNNINNTPGSNIENSNLNSLVKDTVNYDVHPNKTDITSSIELYTIKFFGFHSMIYQTCYIWSNLVSFYILQTGYSNNQTSDIHNLTCSCGATYCNDDEDACSEQNLQQPTSKTRNILLSMCVALCILGAVLVIVFLDSLREKDRTVKISLKILLATLHQTKRKEQILLVPMTMNNGMMKGFFLADFTKSYIGCAWGIRQIGLVAAFSGGSMAFFSLLSGWFVKHLGRRVVFTTAFILNFILNMIFLLWRPDMSQPAMFFVAAGLWGGLFGTFHTQVRAFYGVLFKKDEEAAFGAYQLWYCIGSCMCLASSNILCNNIKIYILMSFTLMGTVGYWMIELCPFKVKKTQL